MQNTVKISKTTKKQSTLVQKKQNNTNTVHPINQLHSAIGNQGMQKLLHSPLYQTKKSDQSNSNQNDADTTINSYANTSSGKPLDTTTRRSMESSFNYNFSNVRVHDNSKSQDMTKSVNADAFTTGNNIFFGKSRYEPSSKTGKGLIAHELAHVVQQGGEKHETQFSMSSVEKGNAYETEANSAALAVMENRPVTITKKVGKSPIQRGIWDVIKSVGGAVVSGAKAVGGAVVSGAKAVGGAVVSGAKAVGGAVSKGVSWLAENIPIVAEIKKTFKNAKDVFGLILGDPPGFLMNLLKAISGGFGQFFDNIGTHLKNGLMGWLFGTMAEAGITLPEKFDFKGVLGLILQVLGLTYDRLRVKAVKLIGEKNVGMIEQVWGYVSTLIKEGPQGLWDQMKGEMEGVISSVLDSIKSWIITTIIKKSIIKIAAFFDPTFISSIIAALTTIYDVVTMVIEKMQQIKAVVDAIINSVTLIAKGQIKTASDWIEKTLARMVPVAIGFLASFVGLGGISGTIKKTIGKIQKKVDKIVDKVIVKVVGMFKGKGKGKGKDEKEKPEKEMSSNVDKVLAEPPASKKRNSKQKKEDVEKAKKIAKLIIKKAKDTDEIDEYFQKMKLRFGLVDIRMVKLGTSSASLKLKVNPESTIILDNGELRLAKIEDGKAMKIDDKVVFTPGKLAGETVGTKMVAEKIGPTTPTGSRTGTRSGLAKMFTKLKTTDASLQDKYIKGHLLSGRLGGPGLPENLYPITAQANNDHDNLVEKILKDWVEKDGLFINYTVAITNATNNLNEENPEKEYFVKSDMKITATPLNAQGKPVSTKSNSLIASHPGIKARKIEDYKNEQGEEYNKKIDRDLNKGIEPAVGAKKGKRDVVESGPSQEAYNALKREDE